MNTTPIRIKLTEEERATLTARSRGQCTAHRDVVRANIVLRLADREDLSAIARAVGVTRKIARKWGERFEKTRLAGLRDKAGRGREPVFSPRSHDALGEARVRAA